MNVCIIANPDRYAVEGPFQQVLDWADKEGTRVYFSNRLAKRVNGKNHSSARIVESEEAAVDESDIIIAIGGDGTILYTARLTRNTRKPILGINSGRLGFLANTQADQILEALDLVREGNYRLDRRYMLEATDTEDRTYHALNEFLFSKSDSTSMVTITAEFDEMLINRYWSDGLIVASPTGSTAYNLSSGGPIVMPNTGVVVVTPINPHTLTTRPLVLPSDKPLRINALEKPNKVLFSYDGKLCESENHPTSLTIRRSNFSIDLIELSGHSYFETLRNKLMWGMDSRDHSK